MSIETVSSIALWEQFSQTVSVARQKNTAFSLQKEIGKTAKNVSMPRLSPIVNRLYSIQKPVECKSTLGTQFDAYA